ncbi:hypothetical protein J6590_034424 [Homalodisca vitripennis]|nr:hypothetical protein J6590_034424 [Homalodisca vitripennis]
MLEDISNPYLGGSRWGKDNSTRPLAFLSVHLDMPDLVRGTPRSFRSLSLRLETGRTYPPTNPLEQCITLRDFGKLDHISSYGQKANVTIIKEISRTHAVQWFIKYSVLVDLLTLTKGWHRGRSVMVMHGRTPYCCNCRTFALALETFSYLWFYT